MSLLDKAKNLVSGSEEKAESDEMAEDWIEEVDSEVDENEGEIDHEIEEEQSVQEEEEWDSAYQFAEEFLEVRGFASMVDFTNKCMAYKINQSPMYRDRITNGVDTMNRITTMKEQMQQISGGQQKESSYDEKAEKLKHANEVIDQAQKLSGEEDAMVNELIGVGHELANSIAQNGINIGAGRDVDSTVTERDERL